MLPRRFAMPQHTPNSEFEENREVRIVLLELISRAWLRRLRLHFLFPAQTLPRAEHRALCNLHRSKAGEADRTIHIVVDRLHSTANEVCFVPKSGPTRILHEILPPFLVRQTSRPGFQSIEIAPA